MSNIQYEVRVKFTDGYISTSKYNDFDIAKYNLNMFLSKVSEGKVAEVKLEVKNNKGVN